MKLMNSSDWMFVLAVILFLSIISGNWLFVVLDLMGFGIVICSNLPEQSKTENFKTPKEAYDYKIKEGRSDMSALNYVANRFYMYSPMWNYINEWNNIDSAIMSIDKEDERKREMLKDYRAEKVAELKELEEKINIERKKYNL